MEEKHRIQKDLLTIGTVESVTKSCFNVFDKVLLGHLHHPFSIKDDIIDYSGSLLQYSFSEINQPKGYKRLVVQDKMNYQHHLCNLNL